jgi:hypothetical protein
MDTFYAAVGIGFSLPMSPLPLQGHNDHLLSSRCVAGKDFAYISEHGFGWGVFKNVYQICSINSGGGMSLKFNTVTY